MASPAPALALSWDQFHRDCRRLARQLGASGPFTAIVAITRGGLVPAAIVARELDIRVVETVCAASYHGEQTQGPVRVLKEIAPRFKTDDGATLLVIDDLVDTGETIRLVRTALPRAHFASVYAKPKGRPLVDTHVKDVGQETWIYFPWDLGLSFQPPIAGSDEETTLVPEPAVDESSA